MHCRADGVFRDRFLNRSERGRLTIRPTAAKACAVWSIVLSVVLNVCITCRAGQEVSDSPPGAQLYNHLQRASLPETISVVPVKCLSACDSGVAVAFSGPKRWTYVYANMGVDDAPTLAAGIQAYEANEDGIIPWRERPEILKKRVIARVPATGLDNV